MFISFDIIQQVEDGLRWSLVPAPEPQRPGFGALRTGPVDTAGEENFANRAFSTLRQLKRE